MKGYRSMLPGLALGLVTTVTLADPIGGSVTALNELDVQYVSNLTVGPAALTDVAIVTGTITNNDDRGWKLRVTSGNQGVLKRGTGVQGAGRQVAYNNITFVSTGDGTLGAGLTAPSGAKNMSTENVGGLGTTEFRVGGTAGAVKATSATVDYGFRLEITVPADTSLLSGSYTDNITLLLLNDT